MSGLVYTVQLDVSGNPFGATFTPTDVSSQAVAGGAFEPISIAWGRQDQNSDVSPTTVEGSLLNPTAAFTPGNTGSPYYPHIRRGLRRRVIVGVNSTTANMSEDYATSIEVDPQADLPTVTNLSGSDILARFGGITSDQNAVVSVADTMRSFLAEEMLLDSPSCLYLMQEGDGATSFADVTGQCPPLVVVNSKYGGGTIEAAQTPSGTWLAGTAVEFSNTNYNTVNSGGAWLACNLPFALSGHWAIELWVQCVAGAPGSPVVVASINGAGITFPGDCLLDATTIPPYVFDGNVHQLVYQDDGHLYVDNVHTVTGVTPPGFWEPGGALTIGAEDAGNVRAGDAAFSGMVSYFAIYPARLGARIAAHYNAGATAFSGMDRTDQRITRLLSYRANTGTNLDTGLSTMGVQDIIGRSLQDCLLEVGQTEAGIVYVDGLGRVNLRSRSRTFNPTAAVTLDMSVSGVEFGSNWREDTQNVLNDVTITNNTTGSDQRFFNAASITQDGEYSTSLTLPTYLDTDALNIAGWMVANGIQAQLTATPLVINLRVLTDAQAQAVLQLAPLDCVKLINCPSTAPAATMQFIVQGGTTSLAADAATVTLNLAPMPPVVGVWDSTNWDDTTAVWAF